MAVASSSAIGYTIRSFPSQVSMDTDQQLTAMLSSSYIAVIHTQYSTSLLSAHLIDGLQTDRI
jgi:hypothetical protein